MRVLCAVTLALHIALGSIEVGCACDDLVHQHGLKHLVWVVLGLKLKLLVKVGVAITQGAVGVGEGPVVILAPVGATLVPTFSKAG